MSRVGKIARLPEYIREQLNYRLDDNEDGRVLLDWLNALPETRKVLETQFNGAPISQQNLSQWRRGGYREWVIQSDLRSRAFDLSVRIEQMEEAFHAPLLAGNLATVLATQYARILADWDGKPNAKMEATLHVMRILCRDIALLQRTMHRATTQKNEFFQKLEDDDKKEIQQMKDKALAPIMALLQEKYYTSMSPGSEGLQRIAAFIAAIDHDQPLPKFDDMPDKKHQSKGKAGLADEGATKTAKPPPHEPQSEKAQGPPASGGETKPTPDKASQS